MAGSINKVTLLGNLGKDPVIRTAQNGNKTASFSLATSDIWNDKQTGERRERTEWHNVVIFNEHLVTIVEKYVRKGSKIYIEGKLQTRKWTDQQGIERYTTEVLLDRFNGEIVLLSSNTGQTQNTSNQTVNQDLDDSVPF